MYDLYFAYYMIGKFMGVVIFLLVCSIILFIGNLIYYFILIDDNIEKFKTINWGKRFLVYSFALTFFIILRIFFPTQEEYIYFKTAKYADEYLKENPSSALNPEDVIKKIDGGLQNTEQIISRMNNILNKGLDKVEKEIEIKEK